MPHDRLQLLPTQVPLALGLASLHLRRLQHRSPTRKREVFDLGGQPLQVVALAGGRLSALEGRPNVFDFLEFLEDLFLLLSDQLFVEIAMEKHGAVIHNFLELLLNAHQLFLQQVLLIGIRYRLVTF